MATEDTPTASASTARPQSIRGLLQQLHENQASGVRLVEALEKEVLDLKRMNKTLKTIANENGHTAIEMQKHCSQYKRENADLRRQLAQLQSVKSVADQNPPFLAAAPSEHGTGDASLDGEQAKQKKKSSKLSTNKSKKKIRYQDISPKEVGSSSATSRSPITEEDRKDSSSSSDNAERGQMKHDKQGAGAVRATQDHRPERLNEREQCVMNKMKANTVHVPETEVMTVESEIEDENEEEEGEEREVGQDEHLVSRRSCPTDEQLQRSSRLSRRRGLAGAHIVVPETMQADSVEYSPIQTFDTTEDDDLGADRGHHYGRLLPLEQSTPMLPEHTSALRKAALMRSTASPHLLQGREESPRGIPSTESQLSVDFHTTQMSPTFSGGEGRPTPAGKESTSSGSKTSIPDRVATEVKRVKIEKHSQQCPPDEDLAATSAGYFGSKAPAPVQVTPKGGGQGKTSSPSTPRYDESGQSETSFLILQGPPRPRMVRQATPAPSRESLSPSCTKEDTSGGDEDQGRKRKSREDDVQKTINTKRKNTNTSPQSRSDINQGSNEFEEIERITKADQHESTIGLRNQIHPSASSEEPTHRSLGTGSLGKNMYKNKGLVQSKLTKDSFKPVVSTSGKKCQDINGGRRVYVDSQNDPYIQRAIQESMVSLAVEDKGKQQGRPEPEFKVPNAVRGPITTDKQALGAGLSDARERRAGICDREMSRTASLDGADEGDFNGSLDPAVRLSFIGEEETDEELDEMDDGRSSGGYQGDNGAERKNHVTKKAVSEEHGTKTGAIPTSNKTRIAEAKGDEQECCAKGRASYSSEDEDLENKEPTFIDDSLDDMFEDDNEEDNNGNTTAKDQQDVDASYQEKGGSERQGHRGNVLGLRNEQRCDTTEVEMRETGEQGPGLYAGDEGDDDQSTYVSDYDRPPRKDQQPGYKFTDVVRKRDDRQKLRGFDCKECAGYYRGLGLTDAEIALRTKNCSRHRGHFSPPHTPEHYWSVDFPDTQTCIQRGYMKEAVEEEVAPKKKRKSRYRPNFAKTKTDGDS